jgi:hypothetical protein
VWQLGEGLRIISIQTEEISGETARLLAAVEEPSVELRVINGGAFVASPHNPLRAGLPAEMVKVKANRLGLFRQRIEWTIEKLSVDEVAKITLIDKSERVPGTGVALDATVVNPAPEDEVHFIANSENSVAGHKPFPNMPLGYRVIARAVEADGTPYLRKDGVPFKKTVTVIQNERDTLRQEYRDFGAKWQPTIAQVAEPALARFNTGNYQLIASEDASILTEMLAFVEQRTNFLLQANDSFSQAALDSLENGTKLARDTVIIKPDESLGAAGFSGNTDPEGDDECSLGQTLLEFDSDGRPKNVCVGAILAGEDGLVQTFPNNRGVRQRIYLSKAVSSTYRNPQRNKQAQSPGVNSLHTSGLAIDIDPFAIRPLPSGKTYLDLMCAIEKAAQEFVGAYSRGNAEAFAEHGPLRVSCTAQGVPNSNPQTKKKIPFFFADHVHMGKRRTGAQ